MRNTPERRKGRKSRHLSPNSSNYHVLNYSSSHGYDPDHDTTYRDTSMGRPALRTGGYSEYEPSSYRYEWCNNEDMKDHVGTRRRRIHHSTKNKTSAFHLPLILALVMVCLFLVREDVNITFGPRYQSSSSGNDLEESHSIIGSDDAQTSIQGLRGFAVEFSDAHGNLSSHPKSKTSGDLTIHDLNAKSRLLEVKGLQETNDLPMENDEYGSNKLSIHPKFKTSGDLTVHDLNVKSHRLKAKGRQIINDRPMENDEYGSDKLSSDPNSKTSGNLTIHDLNAKSHLLKAEGSQIINDRPMENDEYGKGDKAYMGHDSTSDFFFAGRVIETKRIVKPSGRIETMTYHAHSYAVLPLLLDSNPFAISVWVFLSPLTDKEEEDGVFVERGRPRVILSTRSPDNSGCYSDLFGDKLEAGFVLYAQPHYDSGDAKWYRIILEYAQAGNYSCHAIIGSSQKDLLVQEGEWHHIALFATQTSTKIPQARDERMSIYVNGKLAAKKSRESLRLSSSQSKSKTTVGQYKAQNGFKVKSSTNHFDLCGRVGMLSFWETGGRPLLSSVSKRMKIQSENEEDHVVRAVKRAAFDVRAIKELSLQGLFVREPTLLYTFDGRKAIGANDLNSKSQSVNEVMAGRRNAKIVTDMKEMISFTMSKT